MNSTSLLAKASFVLLLLIFGCLVYIIVRDHRLEHRGAAEESIQTEVAGEKTVHKGAVADDRTAERPEYAPLRPRVTPPIVAVTPPKPPAPPVRAPAPASLTSTDSPSRPAAAAPVAPVTTDYASFAGTSLGGTSSGQPAGVTGQVFLRGTPPAEKTIALDPMCGRLHSKPLMTRHFVVGENGALANVFVYIKTGVTVSRRPSSDSVLLDQVGCEYQPYVVGVQTGQALVVRNSDPLLHNVHAQPRNSRERSVTQPTRGMKTAFTLDKPEVFVRFKCDVHPWMFAFVGVVSHPWFGVTDANGQFSLPAGLKAGHYTLAAIHPKAGELTQDLEVSSDGSAQPVTFEFDVPETMASSSSASGQAAVRAAW